MAWNVNTDERFGGVHRAPRIQPYLPARTERLGARRDLDNPVTMFSIKDIGKPVKLDGDTCVLCADADEFYGVIESVNVGTDSGYAIGGVLSDPGHEALMTDEVGDLVVGDLVVAGTPIAVGVETPAKGANVKKSAAGPLHRWLVMAVYGAAAAGRQVMIRKV